MKSFYKDPINRPAFGLSDHITVELHPLERCEHPNGNRRVMSRDLRETKKIAVSQYLREVDILSLVQDKDLCEEKTQVLEKVIITGLDGIMPFKSKKVASNEPPWVNVSLKTLIQRRQQALVSGNMIDYNILRNKVNRARKNCRAKFYEAKVKHLKSCKPAVWWKEVKNLSGFAPPARADPLVDFQHVVGGQGEPLKDSRFLANLINSSFLSPMSVFEPLRARPSEHNNAAPVEPRPRLITEYSVLQKLRTLNPNKASGPDQIPSWLLKDNADILAAPVADILNSSFQESRLPKSWKRADITPLPKQSLVLDVNKHLRPISLTPILSKVAEDYVVEEYIKPAVLVKVYWNQFGTVPNSSTAHALISMLHTWYQKTDGNSSTVRVVLFDFKKAFDLIDHRILLEKLKNFDMPEWVCLWIEDFLTDRHQRVKLSQDCFSEWGRVPAGVPQGTKLGPWLFVVMINDLQVEGVDLWKYVDDTTISETTHKSDCSQIQTAVDNLVRAAQADRFQLNEAKCKELQICFARSKRSFPPVVINNKNIEVVKSAKLLGLLISDDLKWNAHVAEIVKKVASRLYLLRQLKRAGLDPLELICFYTTCIRPVAEYACETFHNSLPIYLPDELERLQKRAFRIIYPTLSYSEARVALGLPLLSARREELTTRLFDKILQDPNHRLHHLLPPKNECQVTLRTKRTFNVPLCKTNRFKRSFLMANSSRS